MAVTHEHPIHVSESDMDDLGHVNNLRYLEWILQAAKGHSAANGWPRDRYLQLGCAWVVRSHNIEYLKPAFAGDQLVVRTWVTSIGKVLSERSYEIVREKDGETLVKASTCWAYVDFQKQVPRRIPPELRDAFTIREESGS